MDDNPTGPPSVIIPTSGVGKRHRSKPHLGELAVTVLTDLAVAAAAFIMPLEGFDQPGQHPGGASGVTLPIGYDLGYHTLEEFEHDWEPHLDRGVYEQLMAVVGKKGNAAAALCPSLRHLVIGHAPAKTVFESVTIPKYITQAQRALPGFDVLPTSAQVALVSLVFNRGTDMGTRGKDSWDTRREMRFIREQVALNAEKPHPSHLVAIANAIDGMRRLWRGKSLEGLVTRRHTEAELVRTAAA